MKKRLISDSWYVKVGNEKDYRQVDLPHDYQIEAERSPDVKEGWNNGYFPTEKAKYVKYLTLDNSQHVILDIDGAYMNTQVFLNENHLATHPYGFTPFLVDMTETLREGTNKLVITTSPFPSSARWYTGNGIYRDVFLWEGGRIRIEPRDLFVTTEKIEGADAELAVNMKISSDISSTALIKVRLISPDGTETAAEAKLKVKEKEAIDYSIPMLIKNASLWSPESPALYDIKVEIFDGDELVDITETKFGIRKIEINVNEGLLLNGKPIKLRGGCIHHDHTALGAAAYPAAEERKVKLLLDAGFNCLRTAHNPPSLAFLEVCDRLGMLVMDEAFDCFNNPKTQNDYHLYFEDWALRDIGYMVLRDRMHPSVISYSIGNEVHEIDGTRGAEIWARKLSERVRELDSTRPVTSGMQKDFVRRCKEGESIDPADYKKYLDERFMTNTVPFVNDVCSVYEKYLDISGNNYYYDRYEEDHEYDPCRVIWGSETQAIYFYDSWSKTAKYPQILGDFTWTAYDNLGEVGCGRYLWERDGFVRGLGAAPYPWRSCYQGDHDLTGRRRPQSYFREAVWQGPGEGRIFVTHPEHFGEGFSGTKWHWYDVDERWCYDDQYVGSPIKADCYTTADLVVWFVNGKEVGKSQPKSGIATLETVYEHGEITAVAYVGGEEVSRSTLQSYGTPTKIRIAPERESLAADNRDLLYVRVSVTDKDGIAAEDFEGELECKATGCELLSFFSGSPYTTDSFKATKIHAFKGQAIAVIRAKEPGDVRLTFFGEGLAGATVSLCAK